RGLATPVARSAPRTRGSGSQIEAGPSRRHRRRPWTEGRHRAGPSYVWEAFREASVEASVRSSLSVLDPDRAVGQRVTTGLAPYRLERRKKSAWACGRGSTLLDTTRFSPVTLRTRTPKAASTSASVKLQCPYLSMVIGVWRNLPRNESRSRYSASCQIGTRGSPVV